MGGGSKAAGGADPDNGRLLVAALELVRHGGHHARAGRAERMAERDRANVHVETIAPDIADGALAIETRTGEGGAAEHLQHAQHLRREGFVQIHEIDIP